MSPRKPKCRCYRLRQRRERLRMTQGEGRLDFPARAWLHARVPGLPPPGWVLKGARLAMMKTQDVRVATALVLQGYLRSNEDGDGDAALAKALTAIRREVDDWAGNLSVPVPWDASALEPEQVDCDAIAAGGGSLSRTPYNLVSLALKLLGEAVDLAGAETVLADFQGRGGVPNDAPPVQARPPSSRRVLIPDNEHGVPEGEQDPVALLRAHQGQPAAVQFIADMME